MIKIKLDDVGFVSTWSFQAAGHWTAHQHQLKALNTTTAGCWGWCHGISCGITVGLELSMYVYVCMHIVRAYIYIYIYIIIYIYILYIYIHTYCVYHTYL